MATTEVGNGSVSVTRMEALASELRLLKSAMSDMQGRLDTLLVEIGNELQPVCIESEPSIEVLDLVQDGTQPQETDLLVQVAEEPALTSVIQEPATATVVTVLEAEIVAVAEAEVLESEAPVDATTDVETAEAIVREEPVAELVAAQTDEITAEVAPIEVAAEPVAISDEPAEPVVIEAPAAIAAEAIEAPAPVVVPENVVPANVLAERRNARKGRSAVARVGRWAAVIALIAIAAGLVATGSGFAGQGELLTVKYVCVLAGDACSIISGIP